MKHIKVVVVFLFFAFVASAQTVITDECPLSFASEVEEDRISAMLPYVSMHTGQASTKPLKASAFTYNFYRGTLHSHTAYSDGDMDGVCPTFGSAATCCYNIGSTALNFNYLGISDHNHNEGPVMTLPKHNSGVSESTNFNASLPGAAFPTVYGLEWGTIAQGGHVLVHDVNKLIGWNPGVYDVFAAKGDYPRLFNVVDSMGGFCILAHPVSTDYSGIFNTAPYNALWDNVIVGVSLLNGPYNSTNTAYSDPPTAAPDEVRYKDLLKKGYHIGPTIDLDNHNSNTMGKSSQGRTVVLENSLSKAALISGYKAMRYYATEDYNVEILFDANSTLIMGTISTQVSNPVLNVSVTDPDGGDNVSKIEIFYGIPGSGTAAALLTSNLSSPTLTYTHVIANLSTYYYYAKITQADGQRMWTSPIWYTKDVTLPISLTKFDATVENNDAVIQWRTSNEKNCKSYSLLRSENEMSFLPVFSCDCKNSVNGAEYEFRDKELKSGIYYYRLIEKDLQEKAIDYGIVYAELKNSEAIPRIYTNSENRSFVVTGLDPSSSKTIFSVFDIMGKKVYSEVMSSNNIKVNDLPDGIYLVQLESGSKILNYKIALH